MSKWTMIRGMRLNRPDRQALVTSPCRKPRMSESSLQHVQLLAPARA